MKILPDQIRIFVGCAGWSGISALSNTQVNGESRLQQYSSVFQAVEINSSFYRSHRQSTYKRWSDDVAENFRFSVKLPRTITHYSRLANVDAALAQFVDEVSGLGKKLSCILLQLPPSFQFDHDLVDHFLEKMRSAFSCMLACEARHFTWFSDESSAMLRAHSITRVMADPSIIGVDNFQPTTNSTYMRLHGSPRMYYSSYSDEFLITLTSELSNRDQPAWVIFDNTASGCAIENALMLRSLLNANA